MGIMNVIVILGHILLLHKIVQNIADNIVFL